MNRTPNEPTPLLYLQAAYENREPVFGSTSYVASIAFQDQHQYAWLVRLTQPCKPRVYLSVYVVYERPQPTYEIHLVQGGNELLAKEVSESNFMQALITGDYSYFYKGYLLGGMSPGQSFSHDN